MTERTGAGGMGAKRNNYASKLQPLAAAVDDGWGPRSKVPRPAIGSLMPAAGATAAAAGQAQPLNTEPTSTDDSGIDYPHLWNDGSSCWIAVIVQLLVGLASLGLGFPGPPGFVRSCRALVEARAPAEELRNLRQQLPHWNLMGSSAGQQCAADFFACLLRTSGPVADACKFTLYTSLNCVKRGRCDHEPRTMTDTDPQTELKVEVHDRREIHSAQLIKELLESEDRVSWTCTECARCQHHPLSVTCEDCNVHVFSKRSTLANAPRVFHLHLGRYKDTCNRTFGEVTLDEHIELRVAETAVRYTLRFVVAHAGISIASGHWFAYERFETRERRGWHIIDDLAGSVPKEVGCLNEATYRMGARLVSLQNLATMLVYVRDDDSGFAPSNPSAVTVERRGNEAAYESSDQRAPPGSHPESCVSAETKVGAGAGAGAADRFGPSHVGGSVSTGSVERVFELPARAARPSHVLAHRGDRTDHPDGGGSLPVALPVPMNGPFPYSTPLRHPAAVSSTSVYGTSRKLTDGADAEIPSGDWARRLELAREEGRARARAQTAALRRSGRYGSPSSLDIEAGVSPHRPAISPVRAEPTEGSVLWAERSAHAIAARTVGSTLPHSERSEGPRSAAAQVQGNVIDVVTPVRERSAQLRVPRSLTQPEHWSVPRTGGDLPAAASRPSKQKGSPLLAQKHMLEALQLQEDSSGMSFPVRSPADARAHGMLPDISADLF